VNKSADNDLLDSNLSSISRLFTATFALVTTSTLAIQFLRQSDHPISELWDDGIYLFAILAALFITLEIVRANKISQSHWVLTACALVGIVLGIVGIDHPIGSNQLWNGFGVWPLIIAILLTPWVWKVIHFQPLNSSFKYILGAVISISSLFSLISVFQGMNSLIYSYPSSFMINESLAVAAGHWPYVDFIPQYQMGNAFLIALLKPLFAPNQLIEICIVFMSLILIFTLIVGVIIVRACLPNRSILVAMALVIPITCVVPFPGRVGYRGSIAEFLSAIPVRIFPGVMILGAIVWVLMRSNMSGSKLKRSLTFIGVACGLVLWNTQDFGIALAVSIFIGLFALKLLSVLKTKFMIIRWFIGSLIGFSIYPLVSLALGKNIRFSDYGFFLRQFGGGFASEPIHTPGPVLLILPLIVSILTCSVWILKRSNSYPETERRKLHFSGAVSLLFSIWAIISLPYYVNRSFAACMLQIFLLPTAIAFGGLAGSIVQLSSMNLRSEGQSQLPSGGAYFRRQGFLLWPLSLVASVFFASMLLTPNPQIEIQRLQGKVPPSMWSISNMASSIADANNGFSYATSQDASVGFLGVLGNYVQLETGVQSASIFNSPADLTATLTSVKVFCTHLISLHLDYLVLGEGGPEEFQNFSNKILCGKYVLTDVPGVRAGHMARLIP
jgi:hypothetical protein